MEGTDAQTFGKWSLRQKGYGSYLWSVRCELDEGLLRSILSRAAGDNEQLGIGYEVHAASSSFTLRWSGGNVEGAGSSQAAVLRASTDATAAAIPAPRELASKKMTASPSAPRPNLILAKHALRHAKWLIQREGLRRCLGHTTVVEHNQNFCDICTEASSRNGSTVLR